MGPSAPTKWPRPATRLKKLDKDGDGKLTRRELMPPRPDLAGRPEGQPEGRPRPEQLVRRLMQGDKNGDGKLSRDELPERMQQAFDRLDANSDGNVSPDELKTGAERLREFLGRDGDSPKKRPNKGTGRQQRQVAAARNKLTRRGNRGAECPIDSATAPSLARRASGVGNNPRVSPTPARPALRVASAMLAGFFSDIVPDFSRIPPLPCSEPERFTPVLRRRG